MQRLKQAGLLFVCLMAVCIMGACEKKEEELPPSQGTYFTFNHYIHFYDEQLQKAIPLCFKANCTHEDRDCDAYVTTKSNYETGKHDVDCLQGRLWNYQNCLYMVEHKDNAFTLCRYDSRGNNKTEIVRLNPEGTFVGMGGLGYGMELIGDYFYYVVAIPREMIEETVTYPEDDTAGFDRDSFRYCIQLYRVKAEPGSATEQISDSITVYSGGLGADKYFLINGDGKKVTFTVCNMAEANDYGLQGYRCEVWTYEEGEKKAQKRKEFVRESEEFSGAVSWAYTSCIAPDGRIYFGTEEKTDEELTVFRLYEYATEKDTFSMFYEMEYKEGVSSTGVLEGNIFRTLWTDRDYLYCYEGMDNKEARFQVFDWDGQLKDTLKIEAGTKPMLGVNVAARPVRLADGQGYFIAGVLPSGIQGMELSSEAEKEYNNTLKNSDTIAHGSAGIVNKSCIGTGKLEIRKIAEYPFAK